jgi:hypothetical protein
MCHFEVGKVLWGRLGGRLEGQMTKKHTHTQQKGTHHMKKKIEEEKEPCKSSLVSLTN